MRRFPIQAAGGRSSHPGHQLCDDRAFSATACELRNRLAAWFARYVVPARDGTRFPVDGNGQDVRLR